MIIYQITNTINNKSYIGQTIFTLESRWKAHLKKLNKNNNYFLNAINKYGIDCWDLKILEEINNINLLNEREIFWISYFDTFNNGYNSTTGGGQGRELSEESRKRMSEAKIGTIVSEPTKYKMSQSAIGVRKSEIHKLNMRKPKEEEHKKKISKVKLGNKYMLGKRHTKETKQKISNLLKGKFFTKEHKQILSLTRQGKILCNNGKINKLFYPDEIPINFIKGKIKKYLL